jgi:hypothetical protein
MKSMIMIAVFCLGAGVAKAQSTEPFWVIETNLHQTDYTILRVYDAQNSLLHEETIKGKAMNVLSRRDRKRINRRVKEVLKEQVLASRKR